VRDSSDRIRGLVTDGDIRRGLLSGMTLDSPISKVMTSPEIVRALLAGSQSNPLTPSRLLRLSKDLPH
jgi:CBS domain-containing protein